METCEKAYVYICKAIKIHNPNFEDLGTGDYDSIPQIIDSVSIFSEIYAYIELITSSSKIGIPARVNPIRVL